ncbi:hypothetical protein TcWFU_005493 [Taenia crassiceps]|uniref:ANK_REP_REGION domain-containing protein n=1 Tax=Taenia crassiceps TaxID=6207 RepID=A0ABR4QEN7_9CEST
MLTCDQRVDFSTQMASILPVNVGEEDDGDESYAADNERHDDEMDEGKCAGCEEATAIPFGQNQRRDAKANGEAGEWCCESENVHEEMWKQKMSSHISVMQTPSKTPENVFLQQSLMHHKNHFLSTHSAHLCGDVCGISDEERKWRDAVLKCNFDEMSRLLSKNPNLANWRDYITGTALHFAAQVNDMGLVRLLAGTYKAVVDVPNHGVSAFYYRENGTVNLGSYSSAYGRHWCVGGSCVCAYVSIQRKSHITGLQWQASIQLRARHRSGKAVEEPISKSVWQNARRLATFKKVSAGDTTRTGDTKPTTNIAKCTSTVTSISSNFISMRKTSKSRQNPGSPQMRSPGWNGDEEMVTRDDLPPTSPTPISGFVSLRKHKNKARPTLPQMEASNFTSELYSTIQMRKSERGKNYNPMDPAFQQTSFRGAAPIKHSRTTRLDENRDGTPPATDMNPRVPDRQPLTKESPV